LRSGLTTKSIGSPEGRQENMNSNLTQEQNPTNITPKTWLRIVQYSEHLGLERTPDVLRLQCSGSIATPRKPIVGNGSMMGHVASIIMR